MTLVSDAWKNVKTSPITVEVDEIDDPPYIRKVKVGGIDDEILKESIEKGQVLPIVIMKGENGRYRLLDGWRRLTALRQIKKERGLQRLEIKAMLLEGLITESGEVEPVSDDAALIYEIMLNNTHARFDYPDLLEIMKKLKSMGYSQAKIAKILDKSRSWIYYMNTLMEEAERRGVSPAAMQQNIWSQTWAQRKQRLMSGNGGTGAEAESGGQKSTPLTEFGAAQEAESKAEEDARPFLDSLSKSTEEEEGEGEAGAEDFGVSVREAPPRREVNYNLQLFVDEEIRDGLDFIRSVTGAQSDSEAARLAIKEYVAILRKTRV